MAITGSTRVFRILGDPVAQVRAPEAFNHLFRRHGVDAAQVTPAHLEGFVRHVLTARNIEGLWLAMQAVAQNTDSATVHGINVTRMIFYTFAINAVLACAAALLVTPTCLAKFDMGEPRWA
jgi:ribose/xylose/arabinose/galactoside ABC-type transport system permease subunit